MPSGSYIMRPSTGVNLKFGGDASGSFLLGYTGSAIFTDEYGSQLFVTGSQLTVATGSFEYSTVGIHELTSTTESFQVFQTGIVDPVANFESDKSLKQAAINIGVGSKVKGVQAVAIATGSRASGSKSIAIGVGAITKNEADGGVAIGKGAEVWGYRSTVIGDSIAKGSFPSSSVVIGTLSTGSADYTVAIGYNVHSANTSSIGIGKNVENYSLEEKIKAIEKLRPS